VDGVMHQVSAETAKEFFITEVMAKV
jgi:hypothetical protein